MISFPSNPEINDLYVYNGQDYIWTGVYWKSRNINNIEKSSISDVVSMTNEEKYITPLSTSTLPINVEVGVCMYWANDTIPEGYLEVNGQSIAAYPLLSALLPTGLPDLRGYFLIGESSTKTLGTTLQDSIQNYTGSAYSIEEGAGSGTKNGVYYNVNVGGAHTPTDAVADRGGSLGYDTSLIHNTSTENRPDNIAFKIIIKHD